MASSMMHEGVRSDASGGAIKTEERAGTTTTTAAATENHSSSDSASGYLRETVEQVNRQIDNDVKAMLDAFDALIKLNTIKDKDGLRIAQERFEAEARADVMVRSAQSLTLLSHALKLSLLLSQDVVGVGENGDDKEKAGDARATYGSLDEEAAALIKNTEEARQTCARLLVSLCDAPTITERDERHTTQTLQRDEQPMEE